MANNDIDFDPGSDQHRKLLQQNGHPNPDMDPNWFEGRYNQQNLDNGANFGQPRVGDKSGVQEWWLTETVQPVDIPDRNRNLARFGYDPD